MVAFDPRVLIGQPFRGCPKCGGAEFGSVPLVGRSLMRRCRACGHSEQRTLPPLDRKVIYLDQMVYSNIGKTLDPVWRAERGSQAPFWLEVFHALERVVKLHLGVCPSSRIHISESIVAPHPEALERVRSYLSAGIDFEFNEVIFGRQLARAMAADHGDPPNVVTRSDALRGRINEWRNRIQITAHVSAFDPDPIEVRSTREAIGTAFRELWQQWKKDGKDFATRYREERGGLYHRWVERYDQHLRLIDQVTRGLAPLSEDALNPPLSVAVLGDLLHQIEKVNGLPAAESRVRLSAFLNSKVAQDIPANDISALLMAAIGRRAAGGQKRVPSRGTWNDVTLIATYLPYCDAMFVDNEFAALLDEEPLRSRVADYKTRIFAQRTRDDFLHYLRALESAAPAEHVALVEEVYGTSWLDPYDSILEDERARRSHVGR